MVALKRYSIQLSETQFGGAVIAAGGKCIVCKTGLPDKETLYDPATELPMLNPLTPVRGKIDFCVAADRGTVDMYIQTPAGQFVTHRNVIPSGDNEIPLHGLNRQQTYVIPFSYLDMPAGVETKTGIVIPLTGLVQPGPFARVTAAEAAKTLNFGTDSGNGGVANGFLAAVSLATAGLVKGSLANGAQTLGADLRLQDSASAGDLVPEQNVNRAGKELTVTLLAGSVAAKGFLFLPVYLAA